MTKEGGKSKGHRFDYQSYCRIAQVQMQCTDTWWIFSLKWQHLWQYWCHWYQGKLYLLLCRRWGCIRSVSFVSATATHKQSPYFEREFLKWLLSRQWNTTRGLFFMEMCLHISISISSQCFKKKTPIYQGTPGVFLLLIRSTTFR